MTRGKHVLFSFTALAVLLSATFCYAQTSGGPRPATDDTSIPVYVDIVDRSGWLLGAESGTPGEGTSVDAYTLVVENVDERPCG